MRQKLVFSFAALIAATSALVAGAHAQAVSLKEQLEAQYKYAKLAADSSGYTVIQEGTLLAVQKAGIKGVAYKNVSIRTATYKDGTISVSDSVTEGKKGSVKDKACKISFLKSKCDAVSNNTSDETTTKFFKVGDKVYPTAIDVNVDKDQVKMTIVACDTCNTKADGKKDDQSDPPSANKANVVFQFAQGALAKASAGDVEDKIGQVLAISSEDQKADSGNQDQNAQQGGQDQQAASAAATEAAAPQAEPQSIEKGMTLAQVEAALGKPQKKVTIGTKQLYIYQDMKVTFINGKVSDVQ